MRRRSTWLWLWVVVSAAVVGQGCGDGNPVAPRRVAPLSTVPVTVRGTVTDGNGAPIVEAELRVHTIDSETAAGDLVGLTGADGTFEVTAPSRAYLVVGKQGYAREIVGPVESNWNWPLDIRLHDLVPAGATVAGVLGTEATCSDDFFSYACESFLIGVPGPGVLAASLEWDGGASALGVSLRRRTHVNGKSAEGPTPVSLAVQVEVGEYVAEVYWPQSVGPSDSQPFTLRTTFTPQ